MPETLIAAPGDSAAASRRKLLFFSGFMLLVSLIFWCWAWANIFRGKGFDFGIFSFGFSAVTAGHVVWQVWWRPQENMATPKSRLVMLVSHILVTANYAVGFSVAGVLGFSVAFRAYCGIFTLLWASLAAVGLALNSEVIRSYEGEPLLGTLEDDMI